MLIITTLAQAAPLPAPLRLPLMSAEVRAGFPSPAESHIESTLDLNELLIQHKAATFFCRVSGHSMRDAGIHDRDLIVIDRSLEPRNGDIVVAAVEGELTVKYFRRNANGIVLEAANAQFKPIHIRDGEELIVWGVVVGVVRSLVLGPYPVAKCPAYSVA
jgi:DNA polymerase V